MRQSIVAPQAMQSDPHCYRFAGLKDRFLFSVIYKNCTSAEEPRAFFATVNWLMTADEADVFLNGKFEVNFFKYVLTSDKILKSCGYNFPEHTAPDIGKETLSVNKQKALISAAYHATTARFESALRAQVFVGCDREYGLFDTLFWVIGACPAKLRKYLSFHVGFSAVSETFGVALAVTYSDVLGVISSTGNYSGAMTVKKIIFLNDSFVSLSPLPEIANVYSTVSEDDKERADKFFIISQDAERYWQFLMLLSKDKPSGADMALIFGEEIFISGINGGLFSEEELIEAYKNRDRLIEMPRVIEILRESIKDTLNEEEDDAPITGGFVIVGDDDDERKPKKGKIKKSKKSDKKKDKKEDKKKDTHEDERDDERDDERKKHKKHEKSDGEKKPSAFKRFFISALKLIISFLRAAIVPAICIFALGGIALGMFWLGAEYIPHLSSNLALLCYALQLVSIVFLSVPFGYILISSIKRENRKPDEQKNEEESD